MAIKDTDIVILDQFSGPTPYALSRGAVTWEEFCIAVETGLYNGPWPFSKAVVVEKVEKLQIGRTAYRRTPSGHVEVFMANWDSSG